MGGLSLHLGLLGRRCEAELAGLQVIAMCKLLWLVAFLTLNAFAQEKQGYNGNLGLNSETFQVALNGALASEGASFRANRGKPSACSSLVCFVTPLTESLAMNTMHNKSDGSVRVIMVVLSKVAPEVDVKVKLTQLMRAIVKAVTPNVSDAECEKAVLKLTADAARSKDTTARFSKNGIRYIFAKSRSGVLATSGVSGEL